jgi:nucleotide-binding universal stress UspA family protein
MPPLKSILCPIDFSEFSVKAYDYAQSLAWHYKAELLVQHVLYSIPAFYTDAAYKETVRQLRTDTLRRLTEFAKRHTRTRVQPKCVVHEGIATDQILSFAEARAVNLIVIGNLRLAWRGSPDFGISGRKGLAKSAMPGISGAKARTRFCISRGKSGSHQHQEDCSLHGFFQARSACVESRVLHREGVQAELTLLHVLEHLPGSADVQGAITEAAEQLKKSVPPRARKPFLVEFLVRIGKPYQQIIEVALEAQTDLVIMGVRGRSSLNSALFGSTTYRVIQLGPCPVLAVHT